MTAGLRPLVVAGLVIVAGWGQGWGQTPELRGLTPDLTPAVIAQQQPTPTPTPTGIGAITGTVVDGVSGDPVSGALVYLQPADAGRSAPIAQTRQVTDPRGRFAFTEIPGEGTYTVAVSKFGYLDGGYGRDHSPADPLRVVALRKDDWVSGLRVAIWRPGAISGVVRDEAGDPVVGVFVRVLSRFRIQGRDDMVAGPLTVTNDRGEYRVAGLVPGRYAVQVPSVQASVPFSTRITFSPGNAAEGVVDVDDSQRLVIGRYPLPPPPQNGRPMSYPIVFHPSASTLAVATLIDLKYGDDRTGIDLTLTPAPAVRVSGLVEGPPDALKSLTLRLLPAGLENAGLGSEVATALVSGDGRFTFINVPAGTYTLDAPVKVTELSSANPNLGGSMTRGFRFPMPPPTQGSGTSWSTFDLVPGLQVVDTSFRSGAAEYSGRMSVTVGASDVTNVVLRLRAHQTFSGKVVVEADPTKPTQQAPARFPLRLDPAAGDVSLGMPQSSFQDAPGTFSIPGVKPGQYFLRLTAFAPWQVKSITWQGRDYANTPFDSTNDADFSNITITITNAVPELTGTVRGANEKEGDAAMVVAFPVDRAGWRNTGLNPTRMKYASVSSTGTYRFASLPAGDYLIAAIDRSLLPVWRETEFLTRLERQAPRITLSWATKTSQDLTVVNIR